jgi:hypothetical protein
MLSLAAPVLALHVEVCRGEAFQVVQPGASSLFLFHELGHVVPKSSDALGEYFDADPVARQRI